MIDLLCFHLFAFIGYLRYLLCHLYRCFVLRHPVPPMTRICSATPILLYVFQKFCPNILHVV